MTLREIDHMDVVAHAGAVNRRPVAAEDAQPFASANGHLRDEGHQIIGHSLRVLTDAPARMRTNRIEVTQIADRPGRIRGGQILQDELDHPLGAAIRVGRTGRRIFADRH